ncbi:MAG: DUF1302 family protein, partial [Thalassotalea sp.]|nr:DUF1302 family protein [Thalassotalea sp.]
MKQSSIKRFTKKPLVIGVAAALMCSATSQAYASNFELGNFDIRFDSTFSVGASWRVEDRNWGDTVGKSNNLNNGLDFSNYHPSLNANPNNAVIWKGEGTYSNNGDSGNLNYDSGETFSRLFKGTHELDIRNDNMGVFL